MRTCERVYSISCLTLLVFRRDKKAEENLFSITDHFRLLIHTLILVGNKQLFLGNNDDNPNFFAHVFTCKSTFYHQETQ